MDELNKEREWPAAMLTELHCQQKNIDSNPEKMELLEGLSNCNRRNI